MRQVQNIVPEEEWAQFINTMRTPLPTTFRITSNWTFATMLRQQLAEFAEKLKVTHISNFLSYSVILWLLEQFRRLAFVVTFE